jgi:hypothetical protein
MKLHILVDLLFFLHEQNKRKVCFLTKSIKWSVFMVLCVVEKLVKMILASKYYSVYICWQQNHTTWKQLSFLFFFKCCFFLHKTVNRKQLQQNNKEKLHLQLLLFYATTKSFVKSRNRWKRILWNPSRYVAFYVQIEILGYKPNQKKRLQIPKPT